MKTFIDRTRPQAQASLHNLTKNMMELVQKMH